MLTALALKAEYPSINHIGDALLDLAIAKAYSTIDRYVGGISVGVKAQAALDALASVLARSYALDDSAFGDEHPVVREQKEALAWLQMVATGKAQLPVDATDIPAPTGSIIAGGLAQASVSKVFNSSLLSRMP